jgi:hypothetical protein
MLFQNFDFKTISITAAIIAGITGIAGLLLLLAVFLWRKSDRLFQPAASVLRQTDPRPPILLLRSFADDTLEVTRSTEVEEAKTPEDAERMKREWEKRRNDWRDQERERYEREHAATTLLDFGLLDAAGPKSPFESLERVVANAVGEFGPCIAVGQPGSEKYKPNPGIGIEYFQDSEWQANVSKWADDAQIIVLIAGWTMGVQWEVRRIIEKHALRKSIVLFPPFQDRHERWESFRKTLETFGNAGLVPDQEPADVIAVFGVNETDIAAIFSKHRKTLDYKLALGIAIYSIFMRSQV